MSDDPVSLDALRAEVSALRGDVQRLEAGLPHLGDRLTAVVAAGRAETGALVRRVGDLGSRLGAPGGSRAAPDSTPAPESSPAAPEDVEGALEARLAMVEDVLDGMAERLEALARDGARTTTELLSRVAAAVDALQDHARQVAARDGAALEALTASVTDALGGRDEALAGLVARLDRGPGLGWPGGSS